MNITTPSSDNMLWKWTRAGIKRALGMLKWDVWAAGFSASGDLGVAVKGVWAEMTIEVKWTSLLRGVVEYKHACWR